MAQEYRGTGNAEARILRGGTFAEFLGATGVTEAKEVPNTSLTQYVTRSTMRRFQGLVYAISATQINVLDPITGLWSVSNALSPGVAPLAHPSDLVAADTTIGGFLCTLAVDNSAFGRWRRFDGTTWTSDISPTPGFGTTSIVFIHKGIAYSTSGADGTVGIKVKTFDLVTRAVANTFVNMSSSMSSTNNTSVFFVVDDRLFVYTVATVGTPGAVFEFSFGTWLDTGLVLPSIACSLGAAGAFRLGGIVYAFVGDNGTTALRCLKFFVAAPGGALQFTELFTPIPAVLQTGSTIGTPDQYRCYGIVDTVTVPGTATAYLYFVPSGALSAIPTLFRWAGEGAPMVVAASPQLTGESGVPSLFYGGGDSFNGLGTTASPLVTVSPEGNAQGTQGVVVSFSAWGDALVVPHDASGGAFTVGLVATQVPSGATGTILRVGPNEIWLTQDSGTPWVNGQAITDTSTGAANQNAATTGGANDKTVEARFFLGAGQTGLGVPITGIATIVPGSVTGGGGAVEVGNEIQNVTADGRTFSFEWDFLSDGVPQALIDNLELFITRP
jgi:hypothetical protein